MELFLFENFFLCTFVLDVFEFFRGFVYERGQVSILADAVVCESHGRRKPSAESREESHKQPDQTQLCQGMPGLYNRGFDHALFFAGLRIVLSQLL